jgi:TolB-like protein
MNKVRLKSIYTLLIFLMVMIFSSQLFGYEREIKDLSEKMAGQIDKSGKKSVAVVDFTDLQGNVTELGRFIAEELSVELMNNVKKIEIIDRNHLKSIMTEHNFSMSGLVDPKTIKKVGQIVGVDAIITGSVTPFGDNIRVTCKVIATDTARVISAGKIEIAKTKAIDELLAKEIGNSANKTQSPQPKKENTKASSDRKSDRIVETNGFVIELKEATLYGKKEARRSFQVLTGNDKILDNFGNKYRYGIFNKLKSKSGSQSEVIETMETIQGEITGEINPNVTSIDLVFVYIGPRDQNLPPREQMRSRYVELEFTNIPIIKED